jgi:hypothetical protein
MIYPLSSRPSTVTMVRGTPRASEFITALRPLRLPQRATRHGDSSHSPYLQHKSKPCSGSFLRKITRYFLEPDDELFDNPGNRHPGSELLCFLSSLHEIVTMLCLSKITPTGSFKIFSVPYPLTWHYYTLRDVTDPLWFGAVLQLPQFKVRRKLC